MNHTEQEQPISLEYVKTSTYQYSDKIIKEHHLISQLNDIIKSKSQIGHIMVDASVTDTSCLAHLSSYERDNIINIILEKIKDHFEDEYYSVDYGCINGTYHIKFDCSDIYH